MIAMILMAMTMIHRQMTKTSWMYFSSHRSTKTRKRTMNGQNKKRLNVAKKTNLKTTGDEDSEDDSVFDSDGEKLR